MIAANRKKAAVFLPLAAALLICAARARAISPITVAVPPGWQQVQSATAPVVIALKGPAQSSFILALSPAAMDMTDRPGLSAFLADVLDAFNRRTLANFTAAGDVQDQTFPNGLTAHYLKATAPGKPPLILAALQVGNKNFIGTLISNIPDLMLPAIVGSLSVPGAPAAAAVSAGQASGQSSDGQLAFTLKPDWRRVPDAIAQAADPDTVFEAKAMGSQVSVTKAKDAESVPIAEEPDVVLQMARQIPEADAKTAEAARFLPTPAGPALIYAAAQDKSKGAQYVVGYLPWTYLGYSVLASGPNAEELVRELFSSLTLGPSAIPGLVAATPTLPSWTWVQSAEVGATVLLLILAAVITIVLRRRSKRRKRPLP
ncbi:MAG TPA: hypothetical protein VNH15_05255 [Elusimicrobiota bacterium]|nr:hypothetical protein [Elusimicrobiota bacterium]